MSGLVTATITREGSVEQRTFATARDARWHVQQVGRRWRARLEGTGNSGVFVTGRGGSKRVLASYEIV